MESLLVEETLHIDPSQMFFHQSTPICVSLCLHTSAINAGVISKQMKMKLKRLSLESQNTFFILYD